MNDCDSYRQRQRLRIRRQRQRQHQYQQQYAVRTTSVRPFLRTGVDISGGGGKEEKQRHRHHPGAFGVWKPVPNSQRNCGGILLLLQTKTITISRFRAIGCERRISKFHEPDANIIIITKLLPPMKGGASIPHWFGIMDIVAATDFISDPLREKGMDGVGIYYWGMFTQGLISRRLRRRRI